MATLVAIAYPEQDTAEKARATVWRVEEELIIQAERSSATCGTTPSTSPSSSKCAITSSRAPRRYS
jgi:uncharacterized membrane protein